MDKYFEGTYRRTPQQNLSGASRNYDVSELINKVQVERRKREEARLVLEKAVIIQSFYRGYVCRRHWKQIFQKEFESKVNALKHDNSLFTVNDLYYLLQRTTLLFPKSRKSRIKPVLLEDINNLLYVLKHFQNVKKHVIDVMNLDRFWIWRVIHFLTLNLWIMNDLPSGHENNVLTILQVLSSFLDMRQYSHVLNPVPILTLMWGELLNHGDLISRIIRPINYKNAYKEHLFNEILHLVNFILKNLIYLINSSDDNHFRDSALSIVGTSIIKPPLSNAVSRCILPNLRSMEEFPLADLARVYLISGKKSVTAESLFRFLYLDKDQSAIPLGKQKYYFELLSYLLFQLYNLRKIEDNDIEDPDYDVAYEQLISAEQGLMLQNSLKLLNTNSRTEVWITYLNFIIELNDNESLMQFCKCLHMLWISEQLPIYTHRIIKNVAFHTRFLKALWHCILSEKRVDPTLSPGQTFYAWDMLAHGVILFPSEADKIIPALTIFCLFLKHHLAILNDDLLYEDEQEGKPDFLQFRLCDIIEIANLLKEVAVGVISLAYPTFSFDGEDRVELTSPTDNVYFNSVAWRSLLEQLISLLRLIFIRDSRRQFTKNGFWITIGVMDIRKPSNQIETLEKLMPFSAVPSSQRNERSFNVYEDRYLATLRCLPFVIDFLNRIMLLQHLINELKAEYQNPSLHFLHSAYVLVQIRRDYIYEDAFDKLNADEVPECRIHIKIHLVSLLGVEEPGIDGGGLFREFIIELLKTAFDPNRGYFLMNRDNELYPNPKIEWIERDYVKHYSFIGRMLGKALYENILVEIPLAEFFLAKLLENKYELHINGLASLDPDLYRNLMSLMTYTADFADLGLDFTLSMDYFGTNKIVELKPNGANTLVSKDNVLEYIHLVARYKIHAQIAKQTEAFLEVENQGIVPEDAEAHLKKLKIYLKGHPAALSGFTSVIPQHWLAMFSTRELQLIISGNETPIDIADMRESTVYAGGYSNKHPTIEVFWRVLSNFENKQKSQLLKFVTSCSRPPLLGFKELYPPFCIQFVENDTMLPSASTCMNILKLPNFQDEETMRQKILYAISSGAGFELI